MQYFNVFVICTAVKLAFFPIVQIFPLLTERTYSVLHGKCFLLFFRATRDKIQLNIKYFTRQEM